MKLYNPTDSKITVTILGTEYTVGPKSDTVDLEESVAAYWLKLHGFLETPKVVKKDEVVEEVKPTKKK